MLNQYDNHGISAWTWNKVAHRLAWTAGEAMDAWGDLEQGFMNPQIELFQVSPEHEYLEKMGEDPNQPGYYHRLSASGYMDCTDWSGPFPALEDAMADLLSQYAD